MWQLRWLGEYLGAAHDWDPTGKNLLTWKCPPPPHVQYLPTLRHAGRCSHGGAQRRFRPRDLPLHMMKKLEFKCGMLDLTTMRLD